MQQIIKYYHNVIKHYDSILDQNSAKFTKSLQKMLTKFDFFIEMFYNNYTGVGVRHLIQILWQDFFATNKKQSNK